MPEGSQVLVVEDEKDLSELLVYNLRRAGYQVSNAATGLKALQSIADRRPDLILLDIMLPELSGTEVASRIRSNPQTAAIPIIMLTAKGEEVDQLVGLTVGADDYVTKPFSMKVLLARVEAVLRRSARPQDEPALIQLGPVSVNMQTHEAMVDSEAIKLTLTEFRILSSLLSAGGRVLSRRILMSQAMGPGVTVTDRTIDVHVTAIRKKLGSHSPMIKTVRGVGYRATLELHRVRRGIAGHPGRLPCGRSRLTTAEFPYSPRMPGPQSHRDRSLVLLMCLVPVLVVVGWAFNLPSLAARADGRRVGPGQRLVRRPRAQRRLVASGSPRRTGRGPLADARASRAGALARSRRPAPRPGSSGVCGRLAVAPDFD